MKWQKLLLSIIMFMFLLFLAWIGVQLNQLAGVFLFALAFFVPVLAFRNYYLKKPRRLVLLGGITIIALVLMSPPMGSGLNLTSSLHLKTGCWGHEESTWPLKGTADVLQSCSYVIEPTGKVVHVTGMAWKNIEIELPITGNFIILKEPKEKADNTYLLALQEVKRDGYVEVPEKSRKIDTIQNALMRKGNTCVYLEELKIADGIAVVAVRGDCKADEVFIQRDAV
jgi:hypothetical protein